MPPLDRQGGLDVDVCALVHTTTRKSSVVSLVPVPLVTEWVVAPSPVVREVLGCEIVPEGGALTAENLVVVDLEDYQGVIRDISPAKEVLLLVVFED